MKLTKEVAEQAVSAATQALDAGGEVPQALAAAMAVLTKTPDYTGPLPIRLVVRLRDAFRERGLSVDMTTVQAALVDPVPQSDDPVPGDDVSETVGSNGNGLQGQEIVFAKPEPWPEKIHGSDLLAELERVFARHVALLEGALVAIALWVLHAWTHDATRVSPILSTLSPESECGKTTVLELLTVLVPRAVGTSNITTAGVFRMIEKHYPTLVIDEIDTFLAENNDLRGILNSGHTRAMAFVVRTVKPDFEPRSFTTWAPKVLAKIGQLPQTLANRSIIIPMSRCTPQEEERLIQLRLDKLDDLRPLARRAARWAHDNVDALREADPLTPGLTRRAADNWRPLLAIADLAGGNWPERARQAALLLTGSTTMQEPAEGSQALADIKELFDVAGEDRMSSAILADELGKREDRAWSEWRNGKAITKTQLARLLRPYGISPKDIRFKEGVLKGYYRASLEEVWSRYLPSQPQQTQQPPPDGKNPSSANRDKLRSVADGQAGESLEETDGVADVADLPRGRPKTRVSGDLLAGLRARGGGTA